MNNIITDINNEIKAHLKKNVESTLIKFIEKETKDKNPLDALFLISEIAEKHFSDNELIKDISTIHEIVKLNLAFYPLGK